MKKILSILITAIMIFSMFSVATATTTDPFAGLDTVTVVALGGSLTQGDGTDYINDWASVLVRDYLPEKFPGHTFVLKNAGIGGAGSDSGVHRFAMDVKSVSPDLVIIEHCVNDAFRRNWGEPKNSIYIAEGKRNVESELRQALQFDKVPYVMLLGLGTSQDTVQIVDAYEEVGNHYGIPMIDANDYIQNTLMADGGTLDYCDICEGKTAEERTQCPAHEIHPQLAGCSECCEVLAEAVTACAGDEAATWQTHLAAGCEACVAAVTGHTCTKNKVLTNRTHSLFWHYASDGTHPNSEGSQAAYLKPLTDYIDANGAAAFVRPDALVSPMFTNETMVQGTYVRGYDKLTAHEMTEIAMPENWSITQRYSNEYGVYAQTYETATAGATLSFKFHGNLLSFIGARDDDLGQFNVVIDKGTENETTATHTQYYETSLGYDNKTVYTSAGATLTDGWHTAEITNLDYAAAQGDTSLKNGLALSYFFTNSYVTEPFVASASADGAAAEINGTTIPVGLGTQSVTITLDGEYDNTADVTPTLFSGGQEVGADITYSADTNAYTITFAEPLSVANKTYLFSADGLTFNGIEKSLSAIITTNTGMYFDGLSFTDAEGGQFNSLADGEVCFTMTGHNNGDATENIFLIMSHKDKDGKIKAISVARAEIAAGAEGVLETTMPVTGAASTDVIELFAWKDGDLVPYTEKIVFSLSSFSFTNVGDNVGIFFANPIAKNSGLTDITCARSENTITVAGKTSDSMVTVVITDESGDIVYLNQFAAENGEFTAQCKLADIADETHVITIQSN